LNLQTGHATFFQLTCISYKSIKERMFPMADISAIFFILFILGIAFPALLTAWWLLFPSLITRAQIRVEKTPLPTFWMGLLILIGVAVPIVVLFVLPLGPAKFVGWILLAASLALSSIGSAGIAAHLAYRLIQHSNVTQLGGFMGGAVVLELAAFFPVIGWFFLWPLLLITAFGATGFALLNWLPREKAQISSATTSPSHA
jgi:hypothetical protein